ncbi:diguanylate cyclase (GGDEF)-like protein/PAS domain S-box-containing protein [Pullulanibacillus pueri]|nr:EAL domain-containing protein [Pullulanibacillus pueri]MBM7682800.1 diguanylate cyclase (GGDEF)-like protein/PAS domain S-box-containing protein [Pullulanibacillus pueri]
MRRISSLFNTSFIFSIMIIAIGAAYSALVLGGLAVNHYHPIVSINVVLTLLTIGIGIVTLGLMIFIFVLFGSHRHRETFSSSVKRQNEQYRTLIDQSSMGIYVIQDENYVYVNRKVLAMLGYQREELIGSRFLDYVHPEDQQWMVEKKDNAGASKKALRHFRMIKKDRSLLYVENFGSDIMYQGKRAAIGTLADITERKRAEDQIQHLAYHDSLTGLPNRQFFYTYFVKMLAEDEVNSVALLSIDLDKFKWVNDAVGREVGDRLLKAASTRLKTCVSEQAVVGRHGGDEFLISLPRVDREATTVMAEEILHQFSRPFYIDNYELYITLSMGISLYPNDGEKIDDLIKKADSVMYQVKKAGRNSYQFYCSKQKDQSFRRLELETQLRKAISRDEFELYYQPKLELTTGKIVGAEALIRWNHPEKGLVSPGEFISIAEESGLIIPLGEWVLRTACMQLRTWQEKGIAPFEVSVNLSVRQLYQPNLVERVRMILEETRLDPKYLELEITESMMADSDHCLKVLNELKSLGVKISLDDFGTGFSSLHYLKEAPIDTLKIDQSFVRHCTVDGNDATIVKTVIAMAHQLNLEVIAEGVETKEQLIFLQRQLCNVAQGFLFSRPLPVKVFIEQFDEMEKVVSIHGLPVGIQNNQWMENELEMVRQELLDTLRLQQGMTFKFIKKGDRFIYTLCEGTLVNKLGLVQEEVIGKEMVDFQPSEEAERKMCYFCRAWAGEKNVSYEAEMNGVTYLASLQPVIKGGKVVEVIASCVDITERKKAEEALRESEARNRLITNNISDLILILNPDGKVTYASPSNQTVLGFPPTTFEGQSFKDIIISEDKRRVQETFDHMILTKTSVQDEFQYQYEGGWLYFDCRWNPVLGDDGEITAIVMVARDITDRKKTAAFVRRTEKLLVVGQLAAGVAHEIRNPLTSIKGFVQLLSKEQKHTQYTSLILSEIIRIEEIIREFIFLAQPQVPNIKRTDIQALLQRVVLLFSSQATLKNVEIIQEYNSDQMFIQCDSHQIKQVFMNILQNALEAMPDGGMIKIQVMSTEANTLKIRFVDQGSGISDERLERIAVPFYSTREKGTGLGLTMSHKIVHEHRGRMNIESNLDEGTTVEILLPIVSGEGDGLKNKESGTEVASPSKR